MKRDCTCHYQPSKIRRLYNTLLEQPKSNFLQDESNTSTSVRSQDRQVKSLRSGPIPESAGEECRVIRSNNKDGKG
jgi:hypothetical protein